MLVLARKKGEKTMIGDDIVIEVVEIQRYRGNFRAKLGITAPREVVVLREEIIRRKAAREKDKS